MNLVWYARRLSRMSPVEIGGRLADAYVKRRWRERQIRDVEDDALPVPTSIPPYDSGIGRFERALVSETAVSRILAAGDAVLAGRFPVFDRARDDLAEMPDWFFDPRTGRRVVPARRRCAGHKVSSRHSEKKGLAGNCGA